MSGKFGKSGKGKGPGVLGVRGGRVGGGKRGLEGRVVTIIGDSQALVKEGEGVWEMISGLEKVDGGWTNGDVRVRECGLGKNGAKRGVVVDGGMDWEANAVGLGGEGEFLEKLLERQRVDREGERVQWKKEVLDGEVLGEVKRVCTGGDVVEGVEDCELGEEAGKDGLLYEWKERKRIEEKRNREEGRKREKEGCVRRGEEKGLGRSEVLGLLSEWKDYKRVVKQAEYVLGITRQEAMSFLLDREIGKVKMMGGLDTGVVGGVVEAKEGVRSEVVVGGVAKEQERVEVAKKVKVVEGGRSYGEVMRGVGPGMKKEDIVEQEVKMRKEREEVVLQSFEREKREVCRVELVLDSQEMVSTDGWKTEEVERELGLQGGEVKKVVGGRGRVVVEVVDKDALGRMGGVKELENQENLGGFKVVEKRRLDRWCGIVVPGVDLEIWEKRLVEFKERFEGLNGVKLMKLPGWLAGEEVRRRLKLTHVGMVVHVAKESERMRLLEEGINWEGMKLKGRKFVNGKEVERCTKCGVVGHSWWRCTKGVGCCDVCGVRGHTGWQHRCRRCNVRGKGCVHYGRCVMCKGNHTSREANEGNCWGVRMEVERLRSLDG